MRSVVIALSVLLLAAARVGAAETPPSIDRALPPAAAVPIPPAATDPAAALPASRKERAEALLETLRTTKDEAAGKEAEKAVLALWLASGSDTVDLLMQWSLQAMENKNYALALDFLDRVTIMKPDYAEGWNKRATVHFLLDDYGRSLADIARVLELEPRHFGALSGLGLIFRALDDDARAMAAYRQALEIDPFLTDVREALEAIEAETAGSSL
jgi:tetratricopeptide (TPR) repeat protein